MGSRSDVRHSLDQGFRLLTGHEHPSRPENHFVIDPTKFDFYAMDCYRIVGEDQWAVERANDVLRLSERPDGLMVDTTFFACDTQLEKHSFPGPPIACWSCGIDRNESKIRFGRHVFAG